VLSPLSCGVKLFLSGLASASRGTAARPNRSCGFGIFPPSPRALPPESASPFGLPFRLPLSQHASGCLFFVAVALPTWERSPLLPLLFLVLSLCTSPPPLPSFDHKGSPRNEDEVLRLTPPGGCSPQKKKIVLWRPSGLCGSVGLDYSLAPPTLEVQTSNHNLIRYPLGRVTVVSLGRRCPPH